MLWPMQALFRFVTGPDVISSIVGWRLKKATDSDKYADLSSRFLILAGEEDVLCTPSILKDAANRYDAAFHHCMATGKLDDVSESNVTLESEDLSGVTFKVAKGLGHHLQNHVEWERGAEEVLQWLEQL